jgi:hypothetical protein
MAIVLSGWVGQPGAPLADDQVCIQIVVLHYFHTPHQYQYQYNRGYKLNRVRSLQGRYWTLVSLSLLASSSSSVGSTGVMIAVEKVSRAEQGKATISGSIILKFLLLAEHAKAVVR